MAEPLYEATVLPSRAVSWDGRLYLEGETAVLPESHADELEIAGFVSIGAPVDAKPKPRTAARRGVGSSR